MKGMTLALLLMAAPAAPAFADAALPRPVPAAASKASPMVSQDPLMRQILRRQITQRNGGITAAVRIASGQSIELQVPDLDLKVPAELKDALNAAAPADLSAGLRPVAGLLSASAQGAPAPDSELKKPIDQLKSVEKKQSWGGGSRFVLDKPAAVPAPGQASR